MYINNMSGILNMSNDEKKKILDKHKEEVKKLNDKKNDLKKGLKNPNDKKTS